MTIIRPWDLTLADSHLIDLALQEDLGHPYFDATTACLFSDTNKFAKAHIISKHEQPVVIAGLPVIPIILDKLGYSGKVEFLRKDGEILQEGASLLTMEAPAAILLMAERTILNFLQRLCAIASLTAKFVAEVKHTSTCVLDTRKTHPGFRHLAKYAVQCGGGINHRMGLYDAIMVKDTHIDAIGGMKVALDRLMQMPKTMLPIIVEVRTLSELELVLKHAPHAITRVLLDNMHTRQLSECVSMCKGILPTEASGNITLNNVREIAECGVDFVSIGRLTHSAGNVDLSMICDI